MVRKVTDKQVLQIINDMTQILQEPGLRISPKLRAKIPEMLDMLVDLADFKAVNTTGHPVPAPPRRVRSSNKELAAFKAQLDQLTKMFENIAQDKSS